eukprot:403331901
MLSFGGFLNSTFWSSYRSQGSASIEELLNNKECSVDKLLEDDDCLQEFKNLNDKLIQYFDHEKMRRLIDLITVVPAEDTHLQGHKFPFIASEIFNCEINSLLDKFFDAPEPKKKEETSHSEEHEEEEEEEKEHKDEEEDKKEEETVEVTDTTTTTTAAPVEEDATATTDASTTKPTEEEPYAQEEDKAEEVPVEVTAPVEDKVDEPYTESPAATTVPTTEEEEKKVEEEPTTDADVAQPQAAPTEEAGILDNKVETEPTDAVADKAVDEPVEDKVVEYAEEATTTQAKPISEPEPEEEDKEEEETSGKFQLLDRLFKFIRQNDTPLNPVLAGYFAKLVTILINRKQKLLIPYVFSGESDVIDRLLFHVYQKSVSEILNKFLNIQDHEYESSLAAEIKNKQHYALEKLIGKLSSQSTEEDNLNAASILVDMLDTKEFFNVICQKQHIQQLIDMAFTDEENPQASSQNAALAVLVNLIQIYQEKRKDDNRGGQNNNDNDDEDSTTIQDEEESTQESPLIEVLSQSVHKFTNYLTLPSAVPRAEIDTSYDVRLTPPLGHLRLRIIELVIQLIKLNKKPIQDSLSESEVFAQISSLVEAYPWNNFLQLKVQNLYEEILDSSNAEFKTKVLQGSKIAETLINLSQKSNFEHSSKRLIRHGYMALVIKTANLFQKSRETFEEVREYLESSSFSGDWAAFVEGELKKSNDTNNRNLGGQQPRTSMDEDENEKDYEMNMEKIMAKFSNFNASMSNRSSSSNTDNDDEEEEEEDSDIIRHQADHEEDEEDSKHEEHRQESPTKQVNHTQHEDEELGIKPIPMDFKEIDPLVDQFADNQYWTELNIHANQSVDELMADYE